MVPPRKLAAFWGSTSGKWIVAACFTLAFVTVLVLLFQDARRNDAAHRGPAAVEFERDPESWLKNPTDTSTFLSSIEAGEVVAVAIAQGQPLALYTGRDGRRRSAWLVPCGPRCSNDIASRLGELSVKFGFALTPVDIDARSGSERALGIILSAGGFLIALTPALLFVGILIYQMKGGASGKELELVERPATRFADVIGAESAKRAMVRVQAFLGDPSAYTELGSRIPRGVLIVGPPGTGKTLLARALAGESGARFISVDGSYFSAMFYGAGIAKVKSLFALARKQAKRGPLVIFFDEIDGLASRIIGGSGAEQESNRILNRFLVEMDGFSPLHNIVVVGATNNVKNVDPALLRPGRFDLHVEVPNPSLPEREALVRYYMARVKAAPDVDVGSLSRMSQGMSPADIANAMNVAAAYAAEAREKEVGMARFIQAIKTKQMGGEVTSANDLITNETRMRLCRHEAGHALAAHIVKSGSVEHVNVESRAKSLGSTYVVRQSEDPIYDEDELRARLVMLLGGREAELITYGNTSSGAGQDLEQATELALTMIGSMGFGETIGLLSMAGIPDRMIGPDLQRQVLDEAKSFLATAQKRAREVIELHRDRFDLLTNELFVKGVSDGPRLQAILNGEPVQPLKQSVDALEAV